MEDDLCNEMICAALDIHDQVEAEEEHDAPKSMSHTNLMKQVRRQGRHIIDMKNRISMLKENIPSTSHGAAVVGGEDNVGHDVPTGSTTIKEDDVDNCCDLNVDAKSGYCEDIFVFQVVIPFVSEEAPTIAFRVDFMKLYTIVIDVWNVVEL